MPLGPPDLSSTAARFATPVTRRRWAAPTYTAEGLPADAAPTETSARAHHWPASGETIERLPEGHEWTDVREGTTSLDLQVDDGTSARADSVVDDVTGIEYTVIAVSPRRAGPGGLVRWRGFVMARRA